MAFYVGLHRYLISSKSGLSPWRVPTGDGVAGQLPGRGASGKKALSSRSISEMLTCVSRVSNMISFIDTPDRHSTSADVSGSIDPLSPGLGAFQMIT